MSMKNPLTPAGIEPATFRFVARHLNHCATAVLPEELNLQETLVGVTSEMSEILTGQFFFYGRSGTGGLTSSLW